MYQQNTTIITNSVLENDATGRNYNDTASSNQERNGEVSRLTNSISKKTNVNTSQKQLKSNRNFHLNDDINNIIGAGTNKADL